MGAARFRGQTVPEWWVCGVRGRWPKVRLEKGGPDDPVAFPSSASFACPYFNRSEAASQPTGPLPISIASKKATSASSPMTWAFRRPFQISCNPLRRSGARAMGVVLKRLERAVGGQAAIVANHFSRSFEPAFENTKPA